MYGIEVSKDKNIISIIAHNTGKLPEKKALQVCSELEKALIDKGSNAIVVRGFSGCTHSIEIHKETQATPIIFLETGKMTSTKKEQFFEVVRKKLKEYEICDFVLVGDMSL
jgi:hypothetical protein